MTRSLLYILIFLSGFAALSWEVVWQLKTSLALGISAWGTALSLAIVIGGMGIGSILMGSRLQKGANALFVYGILEIIIGISGLLLQPAFSTLEWLDTGSALFYALGIVTVLGFPAMSIGATFPAFSAIAQSHHLTISKIYSINTLGAAIGVLMVALVIIPVSGVRNACWAIACSNIFVGVVTCLLPRVTSSLSELSDTTASLNEFLIIGMTGFATFSLEILWFRTLSATLTNTTDNFAIMLASVLIALSIAAKKARTLTKNDFTKILSIAAILILLLTPLLERVDLLFVPIKQLNNRPVNLSWLIDDNFAMKSITIYLYIMQIIITFVITSLLFMPSLIYLGMTLPILMNHYTGTKARAQLYAVNTIAAMLGALLTAWILLPQLGIAKSCWLIGVLVIFAAVLSEIRIVWLLLCLTALIIAIYFESGVGTTRVLGYFGNINGAKVLASINGPEETVSVVEYKKGGRALLIDSATAAGESISGKNTHYMAWLGHLPMLLSAAPKNTLVICFGTGQTANAVREEQAQQIDIVDVNRNIFKLAHYFNSNHNILSAANVHATVMDGRAYLRRTHKIYDVITLEPMPPISVGINALYSYEFYVLAKKRLSANGVIAQWLPFHNVAPRIAASIAKTFIEVFPNAILWIDPISKNGILIGAKNPNIDFHAPWLGFQRHLSRDLSIQTVMASIELDSAGLQRYATYGEIICDDNQVLAYGKALYAYVGLEEANFKLLRTVNHGRHF